MRNFSVLLFAIAAGLAAGQSPIGNGITQPPSAGGVSIGEPITGGDPNDILFLDASGNLAQDDSFLFSQVVGIGFTVINNAQIFLTDNGPGGMVLRDGGGAGIEILDTGNGGMFLQSNQEVTISQTGPNGIYLDNTGGGGIELQDTGGGGIIFSSSTYNFATFTPVSSSPVCVTSAGNLEVGSVAVGLVTCP